MKYNIKKMNTYSRRIKTSFSVREQSLPEEYENSCRLCLTKDSLMTDIYNDDDIVPIPLKLRYCIALEVAKDDGLPSAVCTECMVQLNQYYAFKKRCLATDVKLRQFIKVPSFSKSLMLDVDSSSQEVTLLESSEVNKNSKDACTIKIEESGLMYLHDFYSNNSCSSNGSSGNNNNDENTDKDDDDDEEEEEEGECDNCVSDINDAVNIKTEYLGGITSEICDEKNKNTVSEENRRSTRIMLKRKRRLSPINSTSGNGESISADKEEISIEKKPHTSCKTGYRCSSCNSRFLSYKELQGHIRTNHVETLKMCTICVKSFISNSTLERHMRIHTGEKPFVCQKCGE
ncbi:uncharacterized protein LOC142322342 [Lycorma delicatula]|uniref:uncharacterized protein LOC142322342 n=1 Tax=Lycorma delicatula TaxID=130591 RepID=UPI003F5102C6